MYLMQKIEEVTIETEDARKQVAEFVLSKRSEINDYTIDEIAKECFTSKSTVTRFAKMVGFHGWRDFIKAYRIELQREEKNIGAVDANYPFTPASSEREIAENLRNLQMDSLQDTFLQLDYNMLNRSVNYIKRARKIAIFAIGPNDFYADIFVRKMMMIGYDNIFTICLRDHKVLERTLTKEDCAILISYSGNNANLFPMSHVSSLKEKGVPMIAITAEGDNYLRLNANATLTISTRERLYSKIGAFASEQSLEYLLNCLYAFVYARDYEKNKEYKETLSKEIEKSRLSVPNAKQREPENRPGK